MIRCFLGLHTWRIVARWVDLLRVPGPWGRPMHEQIHYVKKECVRCGTTRSHVE